MPSAMSSRRRVPQQERAERRVAELLDSAASVLAEAGYDATTMTAIAERASASIGAAYQYFKPKDALVLALRAQYGAEMAARMAGFFVGPDDTLEDLASRMVDMIVEFVDGRPAFFAVLDAPVRHRRSKEAKLRLREGLASKFQARDSSLSPTLALRVANVSMQIVKGMSALYGGAGAKERAELVVDYKLVLSGYFRARLRG